MNRPEVVVGIDIGTSGVKTVAVDIRGSVLARGAAALPAPTSVGPNREQDADLWWKAAASALHGLVADVRGAGGDPANIVALAVDGTSGTIVPVDAGMRPLRPGLMYNDGRATTEADSLNVAAGSALDRLGYRFNSSFALAKILWLIRHEPKVMERARRILHQADVVTARLTGAAPVTDESNALKTGYDIVERRWPAYLGNVGIDADRLPPVVPIGAPLGTIGPRAASEFGLPSDCVVVGGMSDGTAACAASGAGAPGDMNTTLGTTIVWKVVASSMVRDPLGRIYSHRHPGGGFLPGGAGNAGGDGIRAFCAGGAADAGQALAELERNLRPGRPTGGLTYPSPARGERFPFVDSAFEPFTTVDRNDADALYRSCLEGVACIERWGYEVAADLGAECDGAVWTTGRGAAIDAWMQIRADFLDRPVRRAVHPESAFGSALVAAMHAWFGGSWTATTRALVHLDLCCEPERGNRAACDEQYAAFRAACEERLTLGRGTG